MKLLRSRRPSKMSTSPKPSLSAAPTISPEQTGPAKLEDVISILDKLSADLDQICLLPHQRDAHLEKLKVYGRDPTNADPIFSKDGIEVLTRHAFNSPSKSTSRNALRCVANAMLLRPKTRQLFVDQGYEAKACNMLKEGTEDDEFLVSRVLFLTTYDTNVNMRRLIDDNHLGDTIAHRIGGYAKLYHSKKRDSNPMEDMALTETLKLLFNLTHHCPDKSSAFLPAVPHILTILLKRPISEAAPLQSPIAQLINALINLDLKEKHTHAALFPKSNPDLPIARFIEYLEMSTKVYTDDELEQLVSPLLTLLRKLYETGPKAARKHMKSSMLPSDKDREKPIGRGDSLSARLLQLSTNPAVPQVREAISTLLFDLSDNDARRFVHNVGYGFAAGFLFTHNIPMPENALEAYSTNDSDSNAQRDSQESSKPINPITGQTLQSESKIELPEMTEEEKEQEAEKLFVLFDRLRRNGAISVKNPMEEAVQQGRFVELDDDDEADSDS